MTNTARGFSHLFLWPPFALLLLLIIVSSSPFASEGTNHSIFFTLSMIRPPIRMAQATQDITMTATMMEVVLPL